jgi:hypothetical protein
MWAVAPKGKKLIIGFQVITEVVMKVGAKNKSSKKPA